MKTPFGVVGLAIAVILSMSPAGAQAPADNALLPSLASVDPAATSDSSEAPDDNAYADGVRAINTARWSDAIAIFTKVAAQGGTHADGALYWKAYAENKQGKGSTALETCADLRHSHPGSNWIGDCGALEIEIHAQNGQPVQPGREQSDELKLLALASLMQHDEKKALAEIDEILNGGDASEKLKQGALYIMGEHHTDTIYPQIARLSLVDGDVRIARGDEDKHHKEAAWEVATNDTPLETGYSLVTGEGRAEIELEDASTLYLAPNSILTFNDLTTTYGNPRTEVALLSGTVTLHVHPYVLGEVFLLHTPTDTMTTKYPQTAYLRVSAYTDGMALTSLTGGNLGLTSAGSLNLTPGQTLYFKEGHRIMDAGPIRPPDFSSWDQWVADRTTARAAATAEALKASGLPAPVPGLADLAGNGSFFACEPYGTCWEPTAAAERAAAESPAPAQAAPPEQSEVVERAVSQSSSTPATTPGRNIQFIGKPAAAGLAPVEFTNMLNTFPCMPDEVRMQFARTAYTGTQQAVPAFTYYRDPAWAWAVCHSGSWLYRGHRYVWVVGHRHHHPAYHWIKSGRTVAYIPLHPHDVKDRPPVNRLSEVFAVNHKGPHPIEPIRLETPEPMQLLKEPPREFRSSAPMPLPRSTEPHMEAHAMRDFAVAKGLPVKMPGTPITFSAKSQSFMMPHQVMQGGRTVSVIAPISNHSGNLQAHGGSFGGGGYHGGAGGGSFHGGGGGGVASGGGSHGGGGSTSSSSSGGSSGGGASAGGGGGHH
jgi:hypothetical protein